MRNFHHILINTLIANVTTSYLWFALVFWVYLETRNVALSGGINGGYMLLMAGGAVFFGSVVDHNRKKSVMMFAAVFTLVFFASAAVVWVGWMDPENVTIDEPALWFFSVLILVGAVVENMRNIALSTTVTLLVPEKERDKANGLVGAVHGVSFLVSGVLSGMSVGLIGMGPTMWVALGLTVVALVHLIPVKIPEQRILSAAEAQAMAAAAAETVPETPDGEAGDDAAEGQPPPELAVVSRGLDLRGSLAVIMTVPGLLALILFTSFNNLIGGVYTALMDAYGLELFSPEIWGVVLGVTSLGFIAGGAIVSRTGLGANPVRTLLLVNVLVAVLGMVFAIREWWWLYVGGIFLFMLVTPAAEAAEQTILQRVVPFRQQGRVFGLAMAVELAANPLSTFVVAILAQAYVIPWMASAAGQSALGWLLGEGTTRGMALMFLGSGMIMLVVVLLAFLSPPYRRLSAYYASTSQDIAGAAGATESPGAVRPVADQEKSTG